MIALVPLVFGLSCLLAQGLGSAQVAGVGGTVIAVLLTVITWRRYVRWTVLRSMSTGVLAALVLSQVALWRPLWPSGCTTIDDAQCTAQSLATLGVGLTAFAFLWWRTRRATDARRGAADIAPGRFIMSPGAARLTIGVALIPLLVGVFWITYFTLEHMDVPGVSDYTVRVCMCYEVCTMGAIAVWVILWRPVVEWNRRRRLATLALGAMFLASPLAIVWAEHPVFATLGPTWTVFCGAAPLFGWALWLAGTAWAWRSGRSRVLPEFAAGAPLEALAVCPTCGYSLRGLREVRCPECGWASTVEDIVARSLERVVAAP